MALENAKPGTRLHAVAEEGIPLRAIAEAVGESVGVPARSFAPGKAGAQFGWRPTHPGLLAGIRQGGYRL
jgi:hypothetical protein